MPTEHEYKVWESYFGDLLSGEKTFEVRKDDREPGPAVGDLLVLREWDASRKEYTGRLVNRRVSYALRDASFVLPGFVILGLVDARREDLERMVDKTERNIGCCWCGGDIATYTGPMAERGDRFVVPDSVAADILEKCRAHDSTCPKNPLLVLLNEKDRNLRSGGDRNLRDEFAAAALSGIVTRKWEDEQGQVPEDVFDRWARGAYLAAEAMVREREKKAGG